MSEERPRITIPVPTEAETKKFCEMAARHWTQETIGARLGWTRSRIDATFRYGRAGVPGFKEFYEAFDSIKFEMGSVYLQLIAEKATKEKNLAAIMFMWERQYGWYEKARQKVIEKEMMAESEMNMPSNALPSDDEVAAAEARALEALNETGSVGERH